MEALRGSLMEIFITGLMEIFVHPPRLVDKVSTCPLASPLARWQAAQGAKVTNQKHEMVKLNDSLRHVVRHLDGSHDRASLRCNIQQALASGELKAVRQGQRLAEIDPEVLTPMVDQILDTLRDRGLLVA